jgi:phage portal protein BeeE
MNEFFGELSMNIEIENSGVVYYRYRPCATPWESEFRFKVPSQSSHPFRLHCPFNLKVTIATVLPT